LADNVVLSVGTADGAVIATDQDASAPNAHYQIQKIAFGALNTFTLVTSSAGLPVAQQGTWTVDLGATDNAVLDAIAASVAGTLTVGSHAVTNAGTFVTQIDGAALTALQLIDNIVRAEDDASAGGHSGAVVLARRTDTPGDQSGTDGDYEFLQVAGGRLWVDASGKTLTVASHAVTNAGTFAVQIDAGAVTSLALIDDPVFADDAAFTASTSKVMMAGAIRDDALSALTPVEGDAVPLRTGSTGALWTTVTGTVTVASHAVTNAGTFVTQIDGSALTALQLIDDIVLAEDAAHTTGDKGVMALAVRQDAQANLGADGDYTPLSVDSAGALRVTGGGGGTEYTEDAAAAANPVGTALILVRKDTPAATVTTDGNNVAQRGSDYGAAYVTLVDNAGAFVSVGGGTQYDEDSAHVSGDKVTLAGVVRADTAAAQSGTDGDRTVLISDASGRLHVNVGNTVTVASHAVTNAGTFVTQVDGAALTALQLIDDVVYVDNTATHSTGTSKGVGIMAAAVPTDTSISANDIGMVGMTTDRRLYVEANIAATQTLSTVTTVGTVSALGISTTGPMKAEDVAHATGDMGIPAWGVRTDNPNATAAATGDYHYLSTDMVGGIRTALYETDFAVLGTKHVKKYYTNAGAVTDGIIWSPAAGTRWYITDLIIQTSAAATITLEDDKAGGDEAVMKFELAANSGVTHSFATPLFSGEDAADLIITTSAGNIYVTATGYEI
jgi:hypothetical protein